MNRYLLASLCCMVLACNAGYTITGNSDAVVQDAVAVGDASLVQDGATGDAVVPQDTLWAYCGDGVLNGNEQCDGQDLGVLTCGTFGFVHGALLCNASCAVDTSGCSNTTVCGDGIAEGDEECDQADFKGLWCGDFQGFVAGQLVCTTSCTVTTAACLESFCGDQAMTEPFEECDGPDLGVETCETQGFDGGVLACRPDCMALDTTACTMDPFCGDGVVDPGEACDEGGNQGYGVVVGDTCEAHGLQTKPNGSPILCVGCQIYTANCTYCGNNLKEAGEECDGDTNTPICLYDPNQHGVCTDSCTLDCSACPLGLCS